MECKIREKILNNEYDYLLTRRNGQIVGIKEHDNIPINLSNIVKVIAVQKRNEAEYERLEREIKKINRIRTIQNLQSLTTDQYRLNVRLVKREFQKQMEGERLKQHEWQEESYVEQKEVEVKTGVKWIRF